MTTRLVPFAPHLLRQANPHDLKVTQLPKYDSSKVDLVDHVMSLKNKLLLHKSDNGDCDNLFCRLFLGTFNIKSLTRWLSYCRGTFPHGMSSERCLPVDSVIIIQSGRQCIQYPCFNKQRRKSGIIFIKI